jgi:hypothetical protein
MENLTKKEAHKQRKRYEVSLFTDKLIKDTEPVRAIVQEKPRSAFFYLGYVGQVGFVIALPIAGGAALGSYLDQRWGIYPKLTVTGLCLGILISVGNFIAVIKEIIRGAKK